MLINLHFVIFILVLYFVLKFIINFVKNNILKIQTCEERFVERNTRKAIKSTFKLCGNCDTNSINYVDTYLPHQYFILMVYIIRLDYHIKIYI